MSKTDHGLIALDNNSSLSKVLFTKRVVENDVHIAKNKKVVGTDEIRSEFCNLFSENVAVFAFENLTHVTRGENILTSILVKLCFMNRRMKKRFEMTGDGNRG